MTAPTLRMIEYFVFILPTPPLTAFFHTFLFTLTKITLYLKSTLIFCAISKFIYSSMTFQKSLTSYETNLTLFFFFLFYSHDPKPKRKYQIASSRAETRSTQSQTCVKYRGNIIFNKRKTDVNTDDLKILHNKISELVIFSGRYL